jgi:diguanylate cyclase
MLNDYFINILVLVAVTFIGGHIIKEVPSHKLNTTFSKIITGLFCGITGILLIIYSIPISENNTLIDLRSYAIMMASYAGGFLPSLIAGVIILIFRIFHFGLEVSSVIAVIQIILYLIIYYLIDKKVTLPRKKWFYNSVISLIVIMISYYYLLYKLPDVVWILLEYSVVLILAGILEYLLLEYVTTSNELYRRYKADSTKDFLTGLVNTRQFDSILNMAFERVQQNHETLSCLMIDIDFFKKINDTYGHAIGDIVLKELAGILQKSIRTVDVVARVGGEEFCVLLFQCPKKQTFEIALAINKAVEEYAFLIGDNQNIHITVSIGISMYPEMTSNLDVLKEQADSALYIAKRSGRNRVCDSQSCMTSYKI